VAETTRFPAAVKQELLDLVARTRGRTGWTLRRILKQLGLTKARYRAWTRRAAHGGGALTDRSSRPPLADGILIEEKRAVSAYALAHPKDGYRRLCH
jgi:transposase-like protein